MEELFTYILKVLVCSGVLLTAYILLLERRVSFIFCRRYLNGIIFLAMSIPLMKIPVWASKTAVTSGVVSVGEFEFQAQIIETPTINPMSIIGIVYLVGVVIMIAIIVRQVVRIGKFDRESQTSYNGKICIARTSSQISSFSFSNTIYLSNNLSDEEAEIIIAHETSHITHRHLDERASMEAIKVFCWWNPFVWIISSKLIEVQEFEADADVIKQGYDTQTYIHIIFNQLFGYSPEITSGLRNSLTKKRFTMMTTDQKSRYALLRIAGTVPIVGALLIAFSFTTKAAEMPVANHTDSQNVTTVTQNNEDVPLSYAQVMPKFNGGDITTFRNWVLAQTKYPVEAIEKDISGTVIATFIIEKDGSASFDGILKSPHKVLSDEVERIIKISPKWTPAKQDGKTVRIKFMLPVDFSSPKKSAKSKPDGNEPFVTATQMPQFQGGDIAAFRKWVMTRVRFPEQALNDNISGTVTVSFIVEKDGSVSLYQILQSPAHTLSEEVKRVILSSPKWTPGQNNGSVVRTIYTIPVSFKISSGTTPEPTTINMPEVKNGDWTNMCWREIKVEKGKANNSAITSDKELHNKITAVLNELKKSEKCDTTSIRVQFIGDDVIRVGYPKIQGNKVDDVVVVRFD